MLDNPDLGGGGAPHVIESAGDYDELRALINARRVELRLKMLDVDVDAGLPSGYFAKLTCGMRNFGPRSLGPVLTALGVEIQLMPACAGTEGGEKKIPRFGAVTRLTNYAVLGGRMRRAQMTNAEWSKHCRKAVKTRWAKRGKTKPQGKHVKCLRRYISSQAEPLSRRPAAPGMKAIE